MTTFTLERGKKIAAEMIRDPYILSQYDLAKKMSKSLTDHGRKHAEDVLKLGLELADNLSQLVPGFLTEWEREVYLPIALFGHDIGRAIDGPKHDQLGAQMIGKYLQDKGMPGEHTREPCWAIRNHRASRCLSLEFDSKVWALLVLADKCVGDEERVTGWKAWWLKSLGFFGVAKHLWKWSNEDFKNSLANFSIKSAQIVVDPNDSPSPKYRGAIVLKVDLDHSVGTLEDILGVEWFSEAFHSCARATQYLGYVFRIEASGTRYSWSKEKAGWVTPAQIDVPRG
ncbi:MAG: hypothetical protein K2W82_15780 [Candidatus Obscuribacterales bacterium]|nr:hypothetical protein [Candidatus Obscuribacterales bacterium]